MPKVGLKAAVFAGVVIAVSACGKHEQVAAGQEVESRERPGASTDAPAPPASSEHDGGARSGSRSDVLDVRVTGPYFTGTQTYEIPVSAITANFFSENTYLRTRSAGGGVEDFLARGSDGSGLYRLGLQFKGGGPGAYSCGDGNEMSLYLRNNGSPDPRCPETAESCSGAALQMVAGSFEVEQLEQVGGEHRLKMSFSGTFERTDTPGTGRDSYQVAGEADLHL